MTLALNLLVTSAARADWSRPLMIGWIIVVLALSVIEVWLMGGFSSRRVSGVNARRGEESMN